MKLVIIRHGEPNYEIDGLTEKGKVEAELLSQKMKKYSPKAVYVSPLGRARETAKYTLEKTGWEYEILDWTQEFTGRCIRTGDTEESYCWDWQPEVWTDEPLFFHKEQWKKAAVWEGTNVVSDYEHVVESLDALLEKHGYRRNGEIYEAVSENEDTIIIFCHFALTAVVLSHLLNISPMVLWHGTMSAPTSVTTVATEERRKGIVSFRMLSFGDTSHLYAGEEPPSFAGRFCEVYNENERKESKL